MMQGAQPRLRTGSGKTAADCTVCSSIVCVDSRGLDVGGFAAHIFIIGIVVGGVAAQTQFEDVLDEDVDEYNLCSEIRTALEVAEDEGHIEAVQAQAARQTAGTAVGGYAALPTDEQGGSTYNHA